MLYMGGQNVTDALAVLQQEDLSDVPAAQAFVAFVAASERGICGYERTATAAADND